MTSPPNSNDTTDKEKSVNFPPPADSASKDDQTLDDVPPKLVSSNFEGVTFDEGGPPAIRADPSAAATIWNNSFLSEPKSPKQLVSNFSQYPPPDGETSPPSGSTREDSPPAGTKGMPRGFGGQRPHSVAQTNVSCETGAMSSLNGGRPPPSGPKRKE